MNWFTNLFKPKPPTEFEKITTQAELEIGKRTTSSLVDAGELLSYTCALMLTVGEGKEVSRLAAKLKYLTTIVKDK